MPKSGGGLILMVVAVVLLVKNPVGSAHAVATFINAFTIFLTHL